MRMRYRQAGHPCVWLTCTHTRYRQAGHPCVWLKCMRVCAVVDDHWPCIRGAPYSHGQHGAEHERGGGYGRQRIEGSYDSMRCGSNACMCTMRNYFYPIAPGGVSMGTTQGPDPTSSAGQIRETTEVRHPEAPEEHRRHAWVRLRARSEPGRGAPAGRGTRGRRRSATACAPAGTQSVPEPLAGFRGRSSRPLPGRHQTRARLAECCVLRLLRLAAGAGRQLSSEA